MEKEMVGTNVRKGYRITSKVRFSIFVISLLTIGFIIGAFVFGWFTGTIDNVSGMEPARYANVTVLGGDTLWSIADAYVPNHTDTRDFISEICKANDLSEKTIYAGQTLRVPIYE